MIGGLEVVLNENMTVKRWVFPVRRFVEYGPEDEGWARRLGYGREVTEPSKECIRLGDTLHMHPATWEAVKRHLEAENRRRDTLTEMVPAWKRDFLFGGW